MSNTVAVVAAAAAALERSKPRADGPASVFLPQSCDLDECRHFIRCTDVKSVRENCNKHLNLSQEDKLSWLVSRATALLCSAP